MASTDPERNRAPGWGRSLARTAAVLCGVTALLSSAVVLGFAVFGEPGGEDDSAMWLAAGMVVLYLLIGVSISVTIANPGRPALAGAVAVALVSIGFGVATVATMPEPGVDRWISHRQVLAVLSFGLGALGGLLLVTGELMTWGRRRPVPAPRGLVFRVSVLGVATVLLIAAAGTSAAHDLAEHVNTDATTSSAPAPRGELSTLKHVVPPYPGGRAVGTPYGLLVTDPGMLAVTAYDAATSVERWHHVRHNRAFGQAPVVSADGRLIALVGDRRDAPSGTSAVVLGTPDGHQYADLRMSADDGAVLAVTSETIVFRPESAPSTMTGFGFTGVRRWGYEAPSRCTVSAVRQAGPRLMAALDCATDDVREAAPLLVALDEQTGAELWRWQSPVVGGIAPGSLVTTSDKVVVDVRRDVSTSEGLFASRLYRHDLSVLSAADGAELWRRPELDLGSTYAVACAGTLQLAGDAVVLGECHHAATGGQATFDVASYSLATGEPGWTAAAPLGYTPGEDSDPSGWFAVLSDGRVAMVTDASNDVTDPSCAVYVAAPGATVKKIKVDEPGDPAWCRTAALHATPNALSVSYLGNAPTVFSLR